jgi:hypothetical protein
MRIQLVLLLLFLGSTTVSLRSQEKFKDTETQLDIFGLGNFHKTSNGTYIDNLSESLGGPEFGLRPQLSGRPGWGMGVGLTQIAWKYIGIYIEQSTFGRQTGSQNPLHADFGYWRWQTSSNLLFRYPIQKISLCPYILVGGGAQYGNTPQIDLSRYTYSPTVYKLSAQGFGQLGGGLEYRFNKNVAIFNELRYLFSNVQGLPNSQMQWKWGIKYIF